MAWWVCWQCTTRVRMHSPQTTADTAGRGFQSGTLGGERFEVSAGREFGNHRFPHRLPNARSLFVHLAQEVARCRRMKTSLAVMVCDIDGLKKINDSFGHLEGDKLLREFSMRLKEACRGYDYVARMGGDEFVVTAPGLTPEAALEKASRLNQAAIEAGRYTCGKDVVSLSVGTAFCPEDVSTSRRCSRRPTGGCTPSSKSITRKQRPVKTLKRKALR